MLSLQQRETTRQIFIFCFPKVSNPPCTKFPPTHSLTKHQVPTHSPTHDQVLYPLTHLLPSFPSIHPHTTKFLTHSPNYHQVSYPLTHLAPSLSPTHVPSTKFWSTHPHSTEGLQKGSDTNKWRTIIIFHSIATIIEQVI